MNMACHKKDCSIDAMERLIDQIDEFEQLVRQPRGLSEADLRQEYRLFNQYIQWRIEDIDEDTRRVLASLR